MRVFSLLVSRTQRFALLALLAALAACARAPLTDHAQQSPAAIRAMTFNVRYGTAQDGNNSWPLRRPLAVRVIRDFAPNVLGVQEALRFQLDEIRAELTHYGEVGVGRDDGRTAGEYSAILYDRNRLELLEQGTFWLSDTPEIPGSMTWSNRFARIATWARFRDRHTRTPFYVFNTHWDHESQPSRERSAGLIMARLKTRTGSSDPILLMGDFNAGEDNPAFRALLSGDTFRFHDTFRALYPGADDVGTYHGFRGDRSEE